MSRLKAKKLGVRVRHGVHLDMLMVLLQKLVGPRTPLLISGGQVAEVEAALQRMVI